MTEFSFPFDGGKHREDTEGPLVVFKFGGTTVGSTERLRRVVDIVRAASEKGRVVAVVSALSMVTRQLSRALDDFTAQPLYRESALDNLVDTLRERHRTQAADLMQPAAAERYEAIVQDRLGRLQSTFEQVRREGFSPALRDAILATGEQLAVPMVALALEAAGLNAQAEDATQLVCTDDTFGEAAVRRTDTADRIRQWYVSLAHETIPVVAGFIGATPGGTTTTLGFEGSDYSAALFAAALDADMLIRYTDVDGIYTKDPSRYDDAEHLDEITMEKAFALTESGRLGMHPKTLRPLVEVSIPLCIRSIVDLEAPGTRIIPAFKRVSNSSPW